GIPDLAVANLPYASGTVSILLGKGDGTFSAAHSYAGGTNPFSLAVADLNGDGYLDLVIAGNFAPNGTVSVLLGNGHGNFGTIHSYVVGDYLYSLAVGDFNGDGNV